MQLVENGRKPLNSGQTESGPPDLAHLEKQRRVHARSAARDAPALFLLVFQALFSFFNLLPWQTKTGRWQSIEANQKPALANQSRRWQKN